LREAAGDVNGSIRSPIVAPAVFILACAIKRRSYQSGTLAPDASPDSPGSAGDVFSKSP
jgi:hypothetical protein